MFKKILTISSILLSTSVLAAHHEETPMIAEIYECSLNEGVMVSDLVDFARSDFRPLRMQIASP